MQKAVNGRSFAEISKYSSKVSILCALSACLLLLNLPVAGVFANPYSVALNLVALAVVFALGWKLTAKAEREYGRISFLGLPRSRLLILSVFGGYSNLCTFSTFGGVMLMMGNDRVPLPLRMPDTSLAAAVVITALLCFLIGPMRGRLKMSAIASLFVLLLAAMEGVVNGRKHGVDTFKLLSSLYVLGQWLFLLSPWQSNDSKRSPSGVSERPRFR